MLNWLWLLIKYHLIYRKQMKRRYSSFTSFAIVKQWEIKRCIIITKSKRSQTRIIDKCGLINVYRTLHATRTFFISNIGPRCRSLFCIVPAFAFLPWLLRIKNILKVQNWHAKIGLHYISYIWQQLWTRHKRKTWLIKYLTSLSNINIK